MSGLAAAQAEIEGVAKAACMAEFLNLVRLVPRGPYPAARFESLPLSQMSEAMHAMLERRVAGKVVIDVAR